MHLKLVFLLCAAAAVASVATAEQRTVLYTRMGTPRDYTKLDVPVSADTRVTFRIALKHRNIDVIRAALMDVSNPKSANYGKWWTREQIKDTVDPSTEVQQLVHDWLMASARAVSDVRHIIDIENRGSSFKVTTTVEVAQHLFGAEFALYVYNTHKDTLTPFVKFIGEFSVPAQIANVIDMVTGITEFPPQPKRPIVVPVEEKVEGSVASGGEGKCNVPYTMKKLYNVDPSIVTKSQMSNQAPYSHDDHDTKKIGFGESDLANWELLNELPSDVISNIIGDRAYLYDTQDSSLAGGEALLDVQMMVAFAPGSNTSFWIMADWIYEFANEILNTPGAPLVNSMSYGWEELNQCDIADCTSGGFPDSRTYVYRTDAEMMQIGLLGITMLAASGDNGVEPDRTCSVMYQVYPASSLYLLTVGASTVISGEPYVPIGNDAPPICTNNNCECSTSQNEVAAMHTNNALFDTGGGFSHFNPRPEWQDYAVTQYYSSGVNFPESKYWNATNRGYPDVAALGGNIAVYQKGKVTNVAGTSASCPIWAGLLTILNDDRIAAKKPTLGFVNPLLYQMWQDDPSTFNDIVVGVNGGNHYIGIGACKKFDFHATKGWDAVSGLGSPNFAKIRQYALNAAK